MAQVNEILPVIYVFSIHPIVGNFMVYGEGDRVRNWCRRGFAE
jgi:hypothetical protein